jgi:hypothetical protein
LDTVSKSDDVVLADGQEENACRSKGKPNDQDVFFSYQRLHLLYFAYVMPFYSKVKVEIAWNGYNDAQYTN